MVLDLLAWALGAYLFAALLLTLALVAYWGTPWKQPVETTPQDLAPGARLVEFEARDGVRLKGYFAPPQGDCPVLIVQAGRRGNRDHMLPWAAVLAQAGYGVFTFDWRAQGESEGRVLSYGAYGEADMAGALAALARQPEAAGRKIGIYACSLGGACVAMAAEVLHEDVACLILDSPYGDLGRMMRWKTRNLGVLAPTLRLCLDGAALLLLRRTSGSIVPEAVLEAFAPRPILVFHGDADTTIPLSEGRSLHDRYPGPKAFWQTEGDGHVEARTTRTRPFMEQLARFFAEHLPHAPDPEAVLARTPEVLHEPACGGACGLAPVMAAAAEEMVHAAEEMAHAADQLAHVAVEEATGEPGAEAEPARVP